MKKACSLVVSALLIAALALPASAASPVSGEAAAILPIDVTLDQEALEIRKVYELPPSADPEALPREGFDRDGYHYECSDILREVVMGDETQTLTQTETVESKNRMELRFDRIYPHIHFIPADRHNGLCVPQIPGVRLLCAGQVGHAETDGYSGVAGAAAAAEGGPRQLQPALRVRPDDEAGGIPLAVRYCAGPYGLCAHRIPWRVLLPCGD